MIFGVFVVYRGVFFAGLVGIGGEICTKGLEVVFFLEVGLWFLDMVVERVGKDMWVFGRGGNFFSFFGYFLLRDRSF